MRIVWQSFIDPAQHTDYFELLGEQLRRAAGAEVLIPAGGLPALVLSRDPGRTINEAIILNGVPVLAKHAEAAVELKRLGLPTASRRSTFALPSTECRDEFTKALARPA